ncbi:MAG: FecR domain-containing protein [Candidatus Hinthialibacter antarcticus]|nr:FecR domain-containing protein [Candidatus Hinthialibacter antarcticus]
MAVKGCCTEWEQEVVLYHDGELSESGCSRVDRHVNKCADCSAFLSELSLEESMLAGRLRRQAAPFAPDVAFSANVMYLLEHRSPETIWTRMQGWLYEMTVVTFVRSRPHMAAAISLLVCLVGALLTAQVGDVASDQYFNITRSGKVMRTTLYDLMYVVRPEGEFFELPDGSTLYASAGTWFSIESFQEGGGAASVGNDRRVSLKSGEIFIDVRPAKEAFSVVTTNSKTTVFGTQFYVGVEVGADKHTLVGVREGRVIVEKLGRSMMGSTVLTNEQQTNVITRNGKTILSAPDPIDTSLLARLDRFYEARSDRSLQQKAPIAPKFEGGLPLVEGLGANTPDL